MFPTLQSMGWQQLWLIFGQDQSLRWIGIHNLYNYVGQEKAKGMLFFHAFTGCDVVSAFRNKGMKTAWQTWDIFPEATPVFSTLSQHPPTIEDDDMEILEKFVVLMYDRSSTAGGVEEARLDLFARKRRPYEAILPTRAALIQHTKRAAYQAGCVWAQAILSQPEAENPADWRWEKIGEEWKVIWTTNSLQMWSVIFLLYLAISLRSCSISILGAVVSSDIIMMLSFAKTFIKIIFFFFAFVTKTSSFCYKKKYTGIFISGKDMNATSLLGAILDAIFDLALKMLFYKNRRPLSDSMTLKVGFWIEMICFTWSSYHLQSNYQQLLV